jgi:hypothetical protein
MGRRRFRNAQPINPAGLELLRAPSSCEFPQRGMGQPCAQRSPQSLRRARQCREDARSQP